MTIFDHHRLRQLRLDGGWSQEELAERVGIDVRTLRRYESGQVNEGGGFDVRHVRRMNLLVLLAQALELPGPEALLTEVAPSQLGSVPGRRVETSHLRGATGALVGRARELEILEGCLSPGAPRLVSIIAWGGAGKTALVQELLARLSARALRGEEAGPGRVLAWTFGEAEAGAGTADAFWAEALRFLGLGGEAATLALPAWEKARRLADHLQVHPALLILDGLEALQSDGPSPGELRCAGMVLLLRRLASWNPGLCVVTSRQRVPGLEGWEGRTALTLPLGGLSDAEGAELLRSLGARGAREDHLAASRAWRGQPLLLQLLGRWMAGGERGGQSWREGDLATLMGPATEDVVRLGPLLEALDPPLREGMALLALLDAPAPLGVIEELLEGGPIPGLWEQLRPAELPATIQRLLSLSLVERTDGGLDLHPLVRQACRQHLHTPRPEATRQGHARLFELYLTRGPERPRDLYEMAPAIQAVRHGCRAGLWLPTWGMVLERLDQGCSLLVERLGAAGVALECFAQAFDRPFTRLREGIPPELASPLLSRAGRLLALMGRSREAMAPLKLASLSGEASGGPEVILAQLAWADTLRLAGRWGEACQVTRPLQERTPGSLVDVLARGCAWGITTCCVVERDGVAAAQQPLLHLEAALDHLLTVPASALDSHTRALASMLLVRGVLCDELTLEAGLLPPGVAAWSWRLAWSAEVGLLPLVEALYQLLEGRRWLLSVGEEGPDPERAARLLLGEEGALARLRRVNFLLFVPLAALGVGELLRLRAAPGDAQERLRLLGEALQLIEGQGCVRMEGRLRSAMGGSGRPCGRGDQIEQPSEPG